MASVPQGSMTVGRNGSDFTDLVPLGDDEYLRNDSGRYLLETGSGAYDLAGAGAARIDCWALDCFQVAVGSTAGDTPYPQGTTFAINTKYVTVTTDIYEPRFAYWMPADTTLVATDVGTKCEVVISGSGTTRVQQSDVSVVTTPVIKVIGVDIANTYALVHALQ